MPHNLIDRLRAAANTEDNHMRCLLRDAAAMLTEQKQYSDHMRHQIADRLPGDIAQRCDSWSATLSAVSRLKTERNNAIEEVERLRVRIAALESAAEPFVKAFERVRSATTRPDNPDMQDFLDHNEIVPVGTCAGNWRRLADVFAANPAQSLADIQARAVESILKDLRSDMPDTNTARRIFQRLQLRVDVLRHTHRVQSRGGSGHDREVPGQNNEEGAVTV